MSEISVRRALAQGWGTLRSAPGLTAAYVGIGLAVPFLLFSIHSGSNFRTFYALAVSSGVSVRDPGSALTIVSLFVLTGVGLTCVAFAAWNALLSESRDGFAGEVMYGVVGGLIASLTSALIYMAIMLPFAVVAVLFGMVLGSTGTPALIAVPVIQLVSIGALLFINARFCMAGPAMAATGSINPLSGLAQSWRLTAPAQWRILLLLLPLQVGGWLLIVGVVALGIALVEGTSDFGWQDRVITAAWMGAAALLMGLFLLVSIGLYRELAPRSDAGIFD